MGAVTPNRDGRPPVERPRRKYWEAEFPYRWDADELVSRRHLLHWFVWASGAFFAGTGILAILGYARGRQYVGTKAIIEAAKVPVGGVYYFRYPSNDSGDPPALLLRLTSGQLVAYSGKCTHLSCSVYWNEARGKILCPCHNGQYNPETGEPIAGPPARPLPRITLREENGMVYAIAETPS